MTSPTGLWSDSFEASSLACWLLPSLFLATAMFLAVAILVFGHRHLGFWPLPSWYLTYAILVFGCRHLGFWPSPNIIIGINQSRCAERQLRNNNTEALWSEPGRQTLSLLSTLTTAAQTRYTLSVLPFHNKSPRHLIFARQVFCIFMSFLHHAPSV